jgi:single-stranded DNA-binding protein
LQVRKRTAQDGSHRKAVEVVAEEVKALDRKREETEQ